MNLVQITPGAGGMYCGNCFRDNALVGALRQQGHTTLMVPLYLPMTLDEEDQSGSTPVFFGGIGVYLEQKLPWFRHAPQWVHHLLRSRRLLAWASGRAAKTQASEVGDIALSMLRGEEGRQARELDELIAWLKTQPAPDAVFLSNAMLAGLARQIRRELHTPVICTLQGEAAYLDSLLPKHRDAVWQTLAERARDIDVFVAPSRFFGELMASRLGLAPDRVRVVPNGIRLDGYPTAPKLAAPGATTVPLRLGFFARMCPDKGLETLVLAYLELRRRARTGPVRLVLGGSCGPSDRPYLDAQLRRLQEAGFGADVEVATNIPREEKITFLRSLDVLSVPALYGEAFGLYVVEALAAGVPVVQPRTAAFPELLDATGGGILCEPNDPSALAEALETLLTDHTLRHQLAFRGHQAVHQNFGVTQMATGMTHVVAEVRQRFRQV